MNDWTGNGNRWKLFFWKNFFLWNQSKLSVVSGCSWPLTETCDRIRFNSGIGELATIWMTGPEPEVVVVVVVDEEPTGVMVKVAGLVTSFMAFPVLLPPPVPLCMTLVTRFWILDCCCLTASASAVVSTLAILKKKYQKNLFYVL